MCLIPPSTLDEIGESLYSDSDWQIVEPQSSLLENQEDMNYDGTPVKAPPASRRKIMPPTPQQSLQPSIEAMQLQTEVEDQESGSGELEYGGEHLWTARDCENGAVPERE